MAGTFSLNRNEVSGLVLEARLEDILRDSTGDDGFSPGYRLEIGFPPREATAAFLTEAQVKAETLSVRQRGRDVVLAERKGPSAWARDATGKRVVVDDLMLSSETMLASAGMVPEVDAVRLALAAFLVPFCFVYSPALLLQGSVTEIIVATTSVGTFQSPTWRAGLKRS